MTLSWDDDGAQEGLLTRRSTQKCLTDHEVEDFLFNRLSGVTREVIEEHLLVCHKCLDRVEDEENTKGLIRAAATRLDEAEMDDIDSPGSTTPSGTREGDESSWLNALKNWFRRPRTSELYFAVAATAVLVLAAGGVMNYMSPATPVEVALWAERGESSALAQAPASSALRLNIDLTTLPRLKLYRLELVDSRGTLLNAAELKAEGNQLRWTLPSGYAGGRYWVRLRDPGQPTEVVREFGLTLR